MNDSKKYVTLMVETFKDRTPLMYQVLHEKGQEFNRMPVKLTQLGPRRKCYMNAYRLSMQYANLRYVEGVATTTDLNLPMEHAWCVDDDGNVYDPTWDNGADYFGMAIKMDSLVECMRKTGVYGFFNDLYAHRAHGVEGTKQMLLDAAITINLKE
jgi:hypothetical protein